MKLYFKLLAGLFLAITICHTSCNENDLSEFVKVDPAFSQYVLGFNSGVISRSSDFTIKLSEKSKKFTEADAKLTEEVFSFSPSIEGDAYWKDAETIVFKPAKALKSDQKFDVSFSLGEVLDLSKEFQEFNYSVRTNKQAVYVTIDGLKPYDEKNFKWNSFIGTLISTDFLEPEIAKKLLSIESQNSELDIQWTHDSFSKRHYFRVDSLVRKETESDRVIIMWDGSSYGIENSDSKTIEIPALNDFKITKTEVIQQPDQHVAISFSDPIDKAQELSGFIRLGNMSSSSVRIEVNSNKILVYPKQRQSGILQLKIEPGIKNSLGYSLIETRNVEVQFLEVKPAVKMSNSGVILPSTDGLILPFQAVNLKAVDVTVTKIYENNIHQFLQTNNSNGSRDLTRVGKKVLKKKVNLVTDNTTDYGKWNNFSLDLEDLIKQDQGAVYRVTIDFNRSYSLYPCAGEEGVPEVEEELEESWEDIANQNSWDYDYYYDDYYYYEDYNYEERDNPCHEMYYRRNRGVTQNILASNIGLLAKLGKNNELIVSASDLRSAGAMNGVTIQLYDYQNQLLASSTSDRNGMARFKVEEKPFLLVALSGNERGYLKLNDGAALNTSHFDVGGAVVQKGIKGLIYGERGVWRPGDTLFLGFILEDKNQVLPENHPVKLEITNPKGQLVERIVKPKSSTGFYTFEVVTKSEDMTGFWSAKVKVGSVQFHKSLRIETIKPNRLKIKFDFEDEVLKASSSNGTMNVTWLHGAKAKNLKAKLDVKLTSSNRGFERFEEFNFRDPMKRYSSDEQSILEGRLDENGQVSFPVNISLTTAAPGLLTASFSARVFEEAGDFSVDRFTMPYSPYDSYVGIKPFSSSRSDVLLTDKTHTTEVVTVDQDGNPINVAGLEVSIFKMNWRWWWDSSSNNNGSYLSKNSKEHIKSYTVNTTNGKAGIELKIKHPDWGRFFIRVTNPETGHSTGSIAYVDWPGWATRTDREGVGASVLTFKSDKESYLVGETASITVPAGGKGRALVTVENGTKVISAEWREVSGTELKYDIEITPEMAPNAFISVTMVQPHKHENSLPIRMYGIVPISVNDPNTILHPEIKMAKELTPETTTVVEVSERDGKEMTYTLAIVDEGLLDITRFKTPKPHGVFYAREALGVKTWDLFDDVIGAYGGELERVLSIGGDGEAQGESDKSKINRFKPMVIFLGPFTIPKNGSSKHKIDIPNYIGSVRTMVIAGNGRAYGHAEETTPVKKPLMVLATLPRVLGPGEKVKLPVTVFAMDEKIKTVTVKVTANGLFDSDFTKQQTLQFAEEGDQVVNFDLELLNKIGKGEVKIEVSGAGEKASYDIELEVRNPNPPTTRFMQSILEAGSAWNGEYQLVGVDGTNSVTLEISNMPAIDLERRLKQLTGYPHGCAEQTTSKAFPQLYVSDVMETNLQFKNRATENINYGIERLRSMQKNSGGFSMWPGASKTNDWVSSYVGHFVIEAEKKGFSLPDGMKSSWLSYQSTTAQSHTEGRGLEYSLVSYYDFNQAYRLYTLALAGKAEIGAMNRLKSNGKLSDAGKWILAGTYHLVGQTDIATQLTAGLSSNLTHSDNRYYYYSYGSSTRNKAITLEMMNLLGKKTEAFKVLKELSDELSSPKWMSTQTVAYSLMAATHFISENAVKSDEMNFSYTVDGKGENNISTSLPFKQILIENVASLSNKGLISVTNNGEGVLYTRTILSGQPSAGNDVNTNNNLNLTVKYTAVNGTPINVAIMEQGVDFIAEVTVSNPSTETALNELALTQIFPSGWEIYNSRMDEGFSVSGSSPVEYQDIRDDRVYTYFNLGRRYKNSSNHKKTFKILLNSAYLGKFYMPSILAEDMYDNEVNAIEKGRWVEVVKPGE
jgi:uncharacterized protein YfaS (alpha-2-macroglobulin family)